MYDSTLARDLVTHHPLDMRPGRLEALQYLLRVSNIATLHTLQCFWTLQIFSKAFISTL